MNWHQTQIDLWRERLRFLIHIFMVVNLTTASAFSVWFTVLLVFRLGQFIHRVLFKAPW